MYAIIRTGNKHYYTSMVFGYYCVVESEDDYQQYLEKIHNKYYLVLNEQKSQLVKAYVYPWENSPYLDPKVLITNVDHSDWTLDDNSQGCISFLAGIDFNQPEFSLDTEQLKRCIELDTQQSYQEYITIKNDADIENLMCVSGYFHDAYIKECHETTDGIYVLFDGIWGCKIEIWFTGNASCATQSRTDEDSDPFWFGATILKHEGFFYLVDDEDMKIETLTNDYCWFKSQSLKYHIIPND